MTIDSEPLVVDLDGTLIRTDLLFESCFLFLRQDPHKFLLLLFWLLQGKSVLKSRLSSRVNIDVSKLPYEPVVVDFIRTEKECGREVILATASSQVYALQVAQHLGLFDAVYSTEMGNNLSAGAKRDLLIAKYCYGFCPDPQIENGKKKKTLAVK